MARDQQAAAIAARLRAELAAARNELALEIDANLREATPVDTGHARANWVPSVGEPATAEVSGAAAHDAGVIAVLKSNLGQDIYVANNAPYIGSLINGSSPKAPAGFDLVAIDQAIATVQGRHDGISIDVSDGGAVSRRGGPAAANVAGAYSPLDDDGGDGPGVGGGLFGAGAFGGGGDE